MAKPRSEICDLPSQIKRSVVGQLGFADTGGAEENE